MSSEELLINIIRGLVLEYRISIDTINKLFNVEKDIYNKIIDSENKIMRNALIYVLDYETKRNGLVDQKLAKRKAGVFLIQFYSKKTSKEKLELIKELNSCKVVKKNKEELTYEDIQNIIKYRYKYVLSRKYIEEMFEVSESTQRCRENKMDEDFKIKLKYLNEYNEDSKFHSVNARKR